MTEPVKVCDSCREYFKRLLEDRTKRILASCEGDDESAAHSHCFHLMELGRIVDGKPTSGMYDNQSGRGLAENRAHT